MSPYWQRYDVTDAEPPHTHRQRVVRGVATSRLRAERCRAAARRSGAAGRGPLGVALLDTGSGKRAAWRGGERFPLCSTFKLLLVAAVLARVEQGHEHLARRIAYSKADLLEYAPVTRAHVSEGGMTVGALCAAAMEYSDNTAANLLLAALGGPSAVTRYARMLGDPVTRLDRTETSLNSAIPGDPRDTTTPDAMLEDLHRLLLGNALSERSRAMLALWLSNCRTADDLIPAGLPRGWRSGNKTGNGANGTVNDVAIVWPPQRAPILIAAYYTGSTASSDTRRAVLREVGRVVAGNT